MRIFRFIVISVVVLFIIITIISLFIPSHVRISRGIQINSSKDSVMKQVGDVSNWKNWYPGADSLKLYYEDNVIKGLILDEQRKRYLVLRDKKNDEVKAEYLLLNKKIPTGWLVATNDESNSVTIQWYMDFYLHWYPWEKFSSFMFERIYHPQLQQGLDNLKRLLEK
ncbi:MAG TPA: SRPBCC family protein [Chitinophagaceae bacterium]|jgi:polyketide cyclase/dehydrase/lipid transport protein|nr:SRPBCC family protein [Chitinophagaceae bacterium]